MSTEPQFTEEQLAQLEAELDRVTVDEVLVQTMVSLLNLGARKAGLAQTAPGRPGPPPDWDQARQAIDAVRALLPGVETRHAEQGRALREMLSQLQMAYSRLAPAETTGQAPEAEAPSGPAQPDSGAPQQQSGDAVRTGRLWVPGQ
jgi:hypothetical protein